MAVLDKEGGANPGFIIENQENRFMCKPICPYANNTIVGDEQIIKEFVFAGIYSNYLGDNRAPHIELLTINELIERFPLDEQQIIARNNNINEQNIYYLVSRYLPNFNGIANQNNLNDVADYESLLSIAIYCGEVDFNHSNIGHVPHNQNQLISAKIDHGHSGTLLNPSNFTHYWQHINIPNTQINRQNMINALNNINAAQINQTVLQRVENLLNLFDDNMQFQDALWEENNLVDILNNITNFIQNRVNQNNQFIHQLNLLNQENLLINNLVENILLVPEEEIALLGEPDNNI